MADIKLNDLTLTDAEHEAVARVAERMKARSMSLYRTSEGLRAFIIDGAGAAHLGVPIGRRLTMPSVIR